ncbi:hypothetical protein ASN_1P43 (plasmid) [Acetobacter senegalensis]|uniref:Bacteriophage T5 Orf172 DNA-binding domain-containing protein n=1 Tax=Acetobacter senegalensis TaxID=446692 RepID=A0A0U5BEI0_9PROT|nr:GIY-YIG nuclease family protein [Acetobacter senegalensis]CEF43077.1 hypothetical protein ASN_1P43 [Acetobacter senegalensis]
MADLSDEELLAELGVSLEAKKKAALTAEEERIIAGFEDICRFYEEHGHAPAHGEDRDIFERLYAVRLDRIRALEKCRSLLAQRDPHGLLGVSGTDDESPDPDTLDDDALLAELGIEAEPAADSITVLKHVKSRAEVRAAEEIASREPCKDFETFRPLFAQVQEDLKSGVRETRPFGQEAGIRQGEFFILKGQMVYVAHVGKEFETEYGRRDSRLRVIYDNGTESDVLLRSLQRALYKDEAGRRITDPTVGPLFGTTVEPDDLESGTIYVLRSLSDNPYIAQHRNLIHKIGVTGGDVKKRIANARHDATYLLADVEVVATYKLFNINRTKLEKIFHRVLAPAQIDLMIQDRFGHPVQPKEWFLAPLDIVSQMVDKISDGSIEGFIYDPKTAGLVKV